MLNYILNDDFINAIFMYLFLWCKAEFSASLLQSSVSHDLSEIMLIYYQYVIHKKIYNIDNYVLYFEGWSSERVSREALFFNLTRWDALL